MWHLMGAALGTALCRASTRLDEHVGTAVIAERRRCVECEAVRKVLGPCTPEELAAHEPPTNADIEEAFAKGLEDRLAVELAWYGRN